MKNIKFYIIIALLATGCTWALVQLYSASTEAKALRSEKEKEKKAIVTEAKEIARKVDEKGIEQVLFDVTANKGTQAQLKDKASTKGLIDTTALALDIRTKQLQTATVINSTLAAENLRLKKQIDASHRAFYTYQGQGLNLKFTPPDASDSTSVATADFSADVKISATQYWKRNWFLGSKRSILAVSSSSPFFKINGADFVEFEQKQPAFGLRIQGSANYNPQTGSLGFGPAARIDLGRLSLQGNYTYYPESERWRPSVNANYDLIRF